MTALHCLDPYSGEGTGDKSEIDVPTLDGKPLKVIYENKTLDLAIIQSDVRRLALQYRTETLEVGNEVAALGFGAGMTTPMLRTAVVSLFLTDSEGTEWILLDNALIPGMSGGPIVDFRGRVVGVNDKSNQYSGMSLSIAQILAATRFWAVD